jgi:hypothetical protein
LILATFFVHQIDLFAQKNTEKFRNNRANGLYHTFNIAVNLNQGNEEYVKYQGDYRLDFYTNQFISYLVGNLEYKKGNNSLITNKGFAHWRFIFNKDNFIEPEVFTQIDYNDFLHLKHRFLIGTGLRFSTLNYTSDDSTHKINLEFGTGLMYEYEKNSDTIKSETKYIRSTSFVSLRYSYLKNFNFFSVSYIQPYLKDLNDFRFFSENRIQLNINDYFAFYISSIYRLDNEPISGLKPFDFELLNGIQITF